jgi:hypothetical protein
MARADAVPRGERRWDDHGGLPSAKRGDFIVELWPHPVHLATELFPAPAPPPARVDVTHDVGCDQLR